jgi:hypothetical protein
LVVGFIVGDLNSVRRQPCEDGKLATLRAMTYFGLTIEQWTAITNVGLTVGLLFFAGMQWWVTHRAEVTRKKERREDDERERRMSYWAVWAEYFRLWSVAQYWQKSDLLELAALRQLRADDFLPRDFTNTAQQVGRLGPEAAQLGGVALTTAFDVSRRVAQLVEFYDRLQEEASPLKGAEVLDYARSHYNERIESEQQVIRNMASEAAAILQDAIEHSPDAHKSRPARYRKPMHSKYGNLLLEDFERRQLPANGED